MICKNVRLQRNIYIYTPYISIRCAPSPEEGPLVILKIDKTSVLRAYLLRFIQGNIWGINRLKCTCIYSKYIYNETF